MAAIALPLLVLLPLLAAAAVLAAPPAFTRRVALAGAAAAFLIALWACTSYPHVRDLRGWFERPGGPVDDALDAAGVEDPLLREALRALLREPLPPAEEAAKLRDLAQVDAARRTLAWTRELEPPAPARVAEAASALQAAEQEVERLERTLATIRAEQAQALRLVRGRSGERVRLPWLREWIPPLGIWWALGVDGLSLPVALVTTLLCLVALLGVPEPRAPAAAGPLRAAAPPAPTRGAVVAVLVLEGLALLMTFALDVALLLVAWAALLAPPWFLAAPRGQAQARAALRVVVVGAVGVVVALIAAGALVAAARQPDSPMTWSVLLLHEAARHGEVPAGSQGAFLAALLVAAATRLPVLHAHAEVGSAAPGWAQGVVLWTVVLGATYPLLRLGWPLAPEAVLGAWGAAAGALGVALIALGSVGVVRAGAPAALLGASVVAHAGLALVGLAAGRALGAAGAVLDVLVTGLTAAALTPVLGGLAARTGGSDLRDLGGLARAVPRLAGLLALGLALLAGVSATTLLVAAGALGSGTLPRPLAALAPVAALLMAGAHLGRLRALAGEPRPERLQDLGDDEALASVPLLVAAVLAGVLAPTLALRLVAPAAEWLTGVAWPAAH